jgi:hypothetical protein
MRMPKKNTYESDDEYDQKGGRLRGKAAKKKKPLAIADFAAQDSDYGDMPDLQTVSNSSDDYNSNDDTGSGVDYLDDDESDDESGYDTEEEEGIKLMMREAMDYAVEKDLLNAAAAEVPSETTKAEDGQANPFLNLLTSLRGLHASFSANKCC